MKSSKQQLAIYKEYEDTDNNICVDAGPGCLAPNTSILMHDGSIKMSQDIRVGDIIMGPDSNPRHVLSTKKGVDEMFKISPQKGDSFYCNSKHILTLHNRKIARSMRFYKNSGHKTSTVDININDFISGSKAKNNQGNYNDFKLIRYAVDFDKKDVNIDPYILGLWLADGTKEKGCPTFSVNTKDVEVVNYLMFFDEYGITPKKIKTDKNCYRISLTLDTWNRTTKNKLREEFKKCILSNKDIIIPKEYLINSRENRLRLLAGIIDGDSHVSNGCVDLITKWDTLNKDVLFLARSLGLAAYSSKSLKKIKNIGFEGVYNRISISGSLSEIPVLLPRRKSTVRKQIKNVLHTGFNIESAGVGEWYGFSVDNDNRFLLGDFTVTHNSGKSTVIKELAKRTPVNQKMIYLAFNKSIAEEIKSKIDSKCEVKTIHAKAYGTLLQNVEMNVKLSEFKNFGYVTRVVKKDGFKSKTARNAYIFSISNIINMLKLNVLEPNLENVFKICDDYDIAATVDTVNDVINTFEYIEREEKDLNKKEKKEINFTDMLYLALTKVKAHMFPKYDVVFVDESQDLNVIQRMLVLRMVKKMGRIISVGDKNQSIYGFMGANLDSFNALKNLPNTTLLPLKESYRCPHRIMQEASKVFPGVTAYKDNIEGVVKSGDFLDAKEGDFVLCRNNKPLVEAFIHLLRHGKKSQIKGKDFGISLLNIMSKINYVRDLDNVLKDCIQTLYDRGVVSPTTHNVYLSMLEKIQIIEKLSFEFNGLKGAKDIIEKLFADKITNSIILSTIHKSKGLEADKVFFMDIDLIDDSWSGEEEMDQQTFQEKCLKYVCLTRAKKELIYCSSPKKEKDEKRR